MAYAPKTWHNGEVIGADDLNHLEQGVASAVGSSGGEVDLSAYAPKAGPEFYGIVKIADPENAIHNSSLQIGKNHETKEASAAIGVRCKANQKSISCGQYCEANSILSAAFGTDCISNGQNSISAGYGCKTSDNCDCAFGMITTAKGKGLSGPQFVCGYNNIEAEGFFIVGGNGKNPLRVTETAVYGANYNSTGADYAELFEWGDGNPDGEDRTGRFVTLDGERIRIAGPEDDYILGIVSGNPSVVGDVHDDQWQGMYLRDIFGRPLWEDVEEPDRLGPEGEVLIPAHIERRQKRNPDYDGSQTYQPRSQRPEWDAVGMLGKLVAVDGGTCQPNGWAAVGEGGIAVASKARTRYRVMSRLDDTHVRILIL